MGTLTQQLCWVSLEGFLKEAACKSESSGYTTGTRSGEHLRRLGRIPEQQSKGTPFPSLAAAPPIPHPLLPGQLSSLSESPFLREKFPDRPFRRVETVKVNN